jgi:hypothetical protein
LRVLATAYRLLREEGITDWDNLWDGSRHCRQVNLKWEIKFESIAFHSNIWMNLNYFFFAGHPPKKIKIEWKLKFKFFWWITIHLITNVDKFSRQIWNLSFKCEKHVKGEKDEESTARGRGGVAWKIAQTPLKTLQNNKIKKK